MTTQEQNFSEKHIEGLRQAYSTLEGMDPCSKPYEGLINLLDKLSQDKLKQLAGANIKFISMLARNRVSKS